MTFRRKNLTSAERLRLFRLHGGICHCCEVEIDSIHDRWDIEHVVAWALTHDDSDHNRRPAHRSKKCHGAKTPIDIANIARAKRREQKLHGAWRPRSFMPGSRGSGIRINMRREVGRW